MEDERTCATVAPKCCSDVANQTVSVLANHANSWRTWSAHMECAHLNIEPPAWRAQWSLERGQRTCLTGTRCTMCLIVKTWVSGSRCYWGDTVKWNAGFETGFLLKRNSPAQVWSGQYMDVINKNIFRSSTMLRSRLENSETQAVHLRLQSRSCRSSRFSNHVAFGQPYWVRHGNSQVPLRSAFVTHNRWTWGPRVQFYFFLFLFFYFFFQNS